MAKQPSKGAKSPKKAANPAKTPTPKGESAKPAVLIDAIPPEVHAKPTPKAAPAKAKPPAPKVAAKDPVPEPAKAPAAAVAAPAPPPRQGGFLPLALGGIVAGAIGFVIGNLTTGQTDTILAEQVAEQSASITALKDQVAAIPRPDLTGIEAQQTALSGDIDALQSQVTGGLADLDARIAELETLPAGDGTISDRAIAAYEAELEDLRDRIEAMTGTAIAQLDEARAEAASIEENAAAAARAAAGRAALARIQISLDDGAPLGAALGDLEDALGAPAPDALLAAQDGVPTLSSLQADFAEVATSALAAARGAGEAGEETTGLMALLKNQFDVRSTTPQDGDGADAVLSRAEAAVKAGRLSDALAETATLPEAARVEMTDWLGRAELRAAATAAIDTLATTLNDS